MKSEAKRAAQETAGIPDSKPFIAPEGSAREERILACHINGVEVRDLRLDPQVIAVLDYWSTDEGIMERNANPNAREASGITLGAGPWEKSLQQKRDDVRRRDMPLNEARDPMREVAQQFAKPGMHPKFMSAKAVQDGLNRDYVVVKDEKGDPVKVRGMILGHIPEAKAEAIQRECQDRGNCLLKQITQQYKNEGGTTAVSDQ